ncbi:hypothetical protein D3C72_1634400 [compost metagenome]
MPSLKLVCAAWPSGVFWNNLGFCTELAEKNAALSLSLRMVSAMNPSSASSNSLRSDTSTSVGILACSWPSDSYRCTGRSSTAPPDCGPIMLGHQRYLAKLSVMRLASRYDVLPHR